MSANMDMATRYEYNQRTKVMEAQAQASMKQAEAARIQAEALAKIAKVLAEETLLGGAFNRVR